MGWLFQPAAGALTEEESNHPVAKFAKVAKKAKPTNDLYCLLGGLGALGGSTTA
jgi:hypothetical protein